MVQHDTLVTALSAAGCAISLASLAAAYVSARPRHRYNDEVGQPFRHSVPDWDACCTPQGAGCNRMHAAVAATKLLAAALSWHS